MKKEMKIEKVEQLIEGYKNIYVPKVISNSKIKT